MGWPRSRTQRVSPGQWNPLLSRIPGEAWLTVHASHGVGQHHMGVQLLQLLVQQVESARGTAQHQLHGAEVAAQVGGGPPQVLGALLQLQLLADLPPQPLPFQLQLLLHPGGCQVGARQAQLLQQGPAAWLALRRTEQGQRGQEDSGVQTVLSRPGLVPSQTVTPDTGPALCPLIGTPRPATKSGR